MGFLSTITRISCGLVSSRSFLFIRSQRFGKARSLEKKIFLTSRVKNKFVLDFEMRSKVWNIFRWRYSWVTHQLQLMGTVPINCNWWVPPTTWEDVVYVLGNFSWQNFRKYVRKLLGQESHVTWWQRWEWRVDMIYYKIIIIWMTACCIVEDCRRYSPLSSPPWRCHPILHSPSSSVDCQLLSSEVRDGREVLDLAGNRSWSTSLWTWLIFNNPQEYTNFIPIYHKIVRCGIFLRVLESLQRSVRVELIK